MMHAAAAGLAAEPFLLRELDAFLADVVIAGEAHDVARHLAGRIEAPVFVLVVHALDLQRRDALGDFRRHLFREEDEIVGLLELLRERPRRRFERLRELRELLRRRVDLAGNAQIDFTGVEIASGSPARSTMRPRCAGTSISRL